MTSSTDVRRHGPVPEGIDDGFYEDWHRQQPDAAHGERAAEWRQRLQQFQDRR